MSKVHNRLGQKYGRLTVIARAGSNRKGNAMWLCQCSCGNTKEIVGFSLNKVQSCGCLHTESVVENNRKLKTTHGQKKTRLYNIWRGMKIRCTNEKFRFYRCYGGRGITICDEWMNSFESFRDWALANGYSDELSIDRINNDGNYEPNNCRWVTQSEQNSNRRPYKQRRAK